VLSRAGQRKKSLLVDPNSEDPSVKFWELGSVHSTLRRSLVVAKKGNPKMEDEKSRDLLTEQGPNWPDGLMARQKRSEKERIDLEGVDYVGNLRSRGKGTRGKRDDGRCPKG